MEHYLLFLQTRVGLWYNILVILIFGLWATTKFLQRIPAASGDHCTSGKITWSEHGMFAKDLDVFQEALISYSYFVEEKHYPDNMIRTYFWNKQEKTREFPKGKEVKVYFSPKEPRYSKAGSPPNIFHVFGSVLPYATIPFIAFNGIATFIFFVVSKNA